MWFPWPGIVRSLEVNCPRWRQHPRHFSDNLGNAGYVLNDRVAYDEVERPVWKRQALADSRYEDNIFYNATHAHRVCHRSRFRIRLESHDGCFGISMCEGKAVETYRTPDVEDSSRRCVSEVAADAVGSLLRAAEARGDVLRKVVSLEPILDVTPAARDRQPLLPRLSHASVWASDHRLPTSRRGDHALRGPCPSQTRIHCIHASLRRS